MLQGLWQPSVALQCCVCVCLQSRLIALCETQEQYFALAAQRQEALGMSTYDEANLDCLSSEASERLHALHEVGDVFSLLHGKHKQQQVAQPHRLVLHLDVQLILAGKLCIWGAAQEGD